MSLSNERAKASFQTNDLTLAIHGESHKQKVEFEKLLAQNPLFDRTDDIYLDREAYQKKCIERSFETYRLVKKNKSMLSAHSPIHGEGGFLVGSLGVPSGLTDHFALFIGTLMMQSSKEQQREWLMKAVNLQIIGTYAQTELGHGSNVRGLETTATYDPATDEFIINSGPKSAAKWWPGALGLLATHSITYARLLIHGKDHGFHAFMVQIRDENHRPLAGVEVGDIGPKMGYNNYDSGYLHLTDIRIPRFNMLAKFQQVEKGGEYKKAPSGLAKIAYLTMLKVRVGIACGAGMAMGKVLTITVRYNLQRTQGFVDGKKGGEERLLLDHTIQRQKIFPALAAAYAIIFSSVQLKKMLTDFEAALKVGTTADTSLLPVLHATAAGMKAFTTDIAAIDIEEVRRCNGGHAFSLNSGIGMFQMTYLPSVTFEGDFAPMALQTARFLVGSVKAVMAGKSLSGPAAYLKEKPRARLSSAADLRNPAKLVSAFEDASRRAVFSVAMSLNNRMKKKDAIGKSVTRFEDAWNAEHIGLMAASKNHTYTYILSAFYEHAKSVEDLKLRAAMMRLVTLFGISRLPQLGRFARISATCASNMDVVTMELLSEIRPDALALVDAFGFSDAQLVSSIGSYENEDMYDKLVDSARKTPLNRPEYVKAFHAETVSKFLNKEYLAEAKTRQSKL